MPYTEKPYIAFQCKAFFSSFYVLFEFIPTKYIRENRIFFSFSGGYGISMTIGAEAEMGKKTGKETTTSVVRCVIFEMGIHILGEIIVLEGVSGLPTSVSIPRSYRATNEFHFHGTIYIFLIQLYTGKRNKNETKKKLFFYFVFFSLLYHTDRWYVHWVFSFGCSTILVGTFHVIGGFNSIWIYKSDCVLLGTITNKI